MSEPLLQGSLALCLFLTELMVDGLAFAFGSHALGRDGWVIGAYFWLRCGLKKEEYGASNGDEASDGG